MAKLTKIRPGLYTTPIYGGVGVVCKTASGSWVAEPEWKIAMCGISRDKYCTRKQAVENLHMIYG